MTAPSEDTPRGLDPAVWRQWIATYANGSWPVPTRAARCRLSSWPFLEQRKCDGKAHARSRVDLEARIAEIERAHSDGLRSRPDV